MRSIGPIAPDGLNEKSPATKWPSRLRIRSQEAPIAYRGIAAPSMADGDDARSESRR
jgi:hypothetical protein